MTYGVSNTGQQAVAGSGLMQEQNLTKTTGKDDFLKLLTMQLKAQDPMKPYDNQEFAAQLAQFSQLEQLSGIRDLLEEQINMNQLLTQTMANSALPGMLGKNAKAMADSVSFDGENSVPFGFNFQSQANSAEVVIKDSAGHAVRTIKLSGTDLSSGEHKLAWDGRDDNGNKLPADKYTFAVTAHNSGGSSYSADTFTYGTIQAVRFKAEGTVLVMNGVEIPLQNILDVTA
jgi:flagellar basal-body rod modification protein FlgD